MLFKIHKLRGRTISYYVVTALFGVASTFYVLRPVLDELEKRNLRAEQQAAVDTLKAAESKD